MKRLFCLIFALPLAVRAVNIPAGVVKPAFFDKEGIKVLSYQKGVGGLNVWQVEKGKTKTVFYTTADNKVLMSGVLWDAGSGGNLSDAYITQEMIASTAAASASQGAAPAPQINEQAVAEQHRGSATKPSEAIKAVSVLKGIKEGRAPIDKTLYIIFDPRCPYCHSVYKKTREYVKNGGTIKWIPTTVLGDAGTGARMVAAILQAKDPVQALGESFTQRAVKETPSNDTRQAISDNENYFFAAFDKNKGAGQPGVPVAFFETKNGMPQMVASIDDDALLKRIFADIKK